MNLDKRQKILIGAFAGILFLWQGSGVLWSIFLGPFDQRSSQAADLDEKLKLKKAAKFQLEMAERRTRIWDRRSLPPVASALHYYHWVSDLGGKHHLDKLVVTPKQINTGTTNPVFTRIPVSVAAECKMDQLCQFLYDFYRADLLHKVTQLRVESLDANANPTLKVGLELEGLSLTSVKTRDKVFLDKQQETAVADVMSKKTLADYQQLIDGNRFVRGYKGPPKPPAPPGPPPTPFDATPHIYLVGYTKVGDEPAEAWLYDRTTNQRTVLKAGLDFEIAGVKGHVLEVDKRFVRVQAKDKEWRLEVGDNIKQMIELKAEAPAGATPVIAIPVSTPPVDAAKKPTT